MSNTDATQLVEAYVGSTNRSLFVTGKAGTGKTTLLKRIYETTTKQCAIVAPTGIAAINAGGATIHSFFQLPPCPYLPDVPELLTEYQTQAGKRKLRRDKELIIQRLDLLIIDEVSMVRADLMDAIDFRLRRCRHNNSPFGGVQLLMFGDVHQLPPVVTEQERPFIQKVYPSPFFFHSKALQRLNYKTIELTKVYRQQDALFLSLLNQLRNGLASQKVLDTLNLRYRPNFTPPQGETFIALTSHNSQADSINRKRLAELSTEAKEYTATITGNYPESAMPTEKTLRLKIGAQVMFVRNDNALGYYNGEIATVTAFPDNDTIEVKSTDGNIIEVKRTLWENIQYRINQENKLIEPHTEGTFSQFPLRLAWAVTIHKAQGLTFDKVMVDASAAFEFGQVYVALSRCRSLEGLVLLSKIGRNNLFGNADVAAFTDSAEPLHDVADQLIGSQTDYFYNTIKELLDMESLLSAAAIAYGHFQRLATSMDSATRAALHKAATTTIPSLNDVYHRFSKQLDNLRMQFQNATDEPILNERITKAIDYFGTQLNLIADETEACRNATTDNQENNKRLSSSLKNFFELLDMKRQCIAQLVGLQFSPELYVKARKKYFINAETAAPSSEKRKKRNFDSLHPELAEQLVEWRDMVADENNLPKSSVIHLRTLLQIADDMPLNTSMLSMVSGIGKRKCELYGSQIVTIVRSYAQENGLLNPDATELTAANTDASQAANDIKTSDDTTLHLHVTLSDKDKQPSWLRSASLYIDGMNIESIAKECGLSVSTIEKHLERAVETGVMDIETICPSDAIDEIVDYIINNRPESLTEIHNHFGERYSWLQLRLAKKFAQSIL